MIFLSYSWKDHSLAHDIDAQLRAIGMPTWIDYRDLRPDSEILRQLDAAIHHCDLFLAIGKKRTSKSAWMQTELALARAYAKPVIRFSHEPLTASALGPSVHALCSRVRREFLMPARCTLQLTYDRDSATAR
jgi:hypothetical protein